MQLLGQTWLWPALGLGLAPPIWCLLGHKLSDPTEKFVHFKVWPFMACEVFSLHFFASFFFLGGSVQSVEGPLEIYSRYAGRKREAT